jgi:hypothetical protein
MDGPAFNPAEALVLLKRQLRDLKPLVERGSRYEINGRPVIELAAGEAAIDAKIAKRPATSPEWARLALASSLDVRKFLDDVKQRLRRWETEE